MIQKTFSKRKRHALCHYVGLATATAEVHPDALMPNSDLLIRSDLLVHGCNSLMYNMSETSSLHSAMCTSLGHRYMDVNWI